MKLLVPLVLFTVSTVHSLSPIIIIPGLLGSQLEAKLNKSSSPSPLCRKQSDWYTLWVDIRLVIPGIDECFVNNAKLVYDQATKQYYNNEGVQIRVPGFGGTDTVEYLDEALIKIPYFKTFVKHFEKLGYTKGKDLNAAPFDWRYAPDGLTRIGYYKALYQLIENSYTRNNNTPVTLVAHSYGGPVTLYFLSKYVQSTEWKASRIKQFISLSGAFGGTVKVALGLVSGDTEEVVTARNSVLREAQRTYPSQVYLLPSTKLWNSDEAIVTGSNKTYTAFNVEALFADMNYENGSRILSEVQNLTADFPAPNVTHYCFYGTNVSTISTLVYGDSFPDQKPDTKYGNGDGVVNARSLESCLLWKDKQEMPVVTRSFPHVKHFGMTFDSDVLTATSELVLN